MQPSRYASWPGIIPACAGEHSTIWMSGLWSMGSSPHARGALMFCMATFERLGIIPACAGSTSRYRSRARPSRDHPRMRGEHSGRLQELADEQGSSPHARGARGREPGRAVGGGIIPACAGSTGTGTGRTVRRRDHPRMRGEHRRAARPRAQGRGIIPACAGSTSTSGTTRAPT